MPTRTTDKKGEAISRLVRKVALRIEPKPSERDVLFVQSHLNDLVDECSIDLSKGTREKVTNLFNLRRRDREIGAQSVLF